MRDLTTFKEILTGEKNIAEWGRGKWQTKQNAHLMFTKFLKEATATNEYTELDAKIKNNVNSIVKVQNYTSDEELILIFNYANRKNVFTFDDINFYCSIEKRSLNDLIKETLADMHEVNLTKALAASNIIADQEFIDLYEKSSVVEELKFKPLEFIEKELTSYDKPISKQALIDKAVSYGFKEKTVKNILRLTTNNKDTIINLGDEVCDKDVFFNNYIDVNFANQFTMATIAVCEQNNVCSTDIKWIKNAVDKKYPTINTNQYSPYELKAILCNEPQFKKDVKFNVIYLDKQCQFQPSNMSELVEKLLEDYKLPISFGFLCEKINEMGKDFSRSTLASTVLPNCENVVKSGGGWILSDRRDYAEAFIEKAKQIEPIQIIERLKKRFKVVTLADLAKKMKVPLYLIMDFNYGSTTLEHFLAKLVENNWKPSLYDDKFSVSRK